MSAPPHAYSGIGGTGTGSRVQLLLEAGGQRCVWYTGGTAQGLTGRAACWGARAPPEMVARVARPRRAVRTCASPRRARVISTLRFIVIVEDVLRHIAGEVFPIPVRMSREALLRAPAGIPQWTTIMVIAALYDGHPPLSPSAQRLQPSR